MYQDRVRWNRKLEGEKRVVPPSPLVEKYYRLAPGPRVLDLAAGTGRNAIFLARRSFQVFAVDIADKAIAELRRMEHTNIMPVQADLDNFPLRARHFDLIVSSRYLDRRLYPAMQESLVPSGILLFESVMESSLPGVSQPRNREYLLRSNELLHAFVNLRIIFYEETVRQDYLFPEKTVCLAMLAAQRGPADNRRLADNF